MTAKAIRIGQIVPSSNTTMETEIPQILRLREMVEPERFTFHSSRMRMKKVTKSELEAMDKDSDRCVLELSDASMDVIGYASVSEKRLEKVTAENDHSAPVVTSAGALIHGLQTLNARKIAVIAPYMRPLTELVIDYIQDQGVEVIDSISLEIPDNLEVGRQNPMALCKIVQDLKIDGADAVVLSACVQMPSFPAIREVENSIQLPVVSAAVCTAFQMLQKLNLKTFVPGGGMLLSGKY